jgi:hypothetical protein
MVTFLELECRGITHEKINLGFILKALDFSNRIRFIAHESHIKTIKNQLQEIEKQKIDFITIELPEKHYKISSIWYYYKTFKKLENIINESEKLIFLSFFSWSLIGLNLFLKLNQIKIKSVFFICHGVQENIFSLRKFKRFKKFIKPKNLHVFFTEIAYNLFKSKKFYFIFLSRHIESNFIKLFSNSIRINFLTINIPYKFDYFDLKKVSENLNFGTVGKGDIDSTYKLLLRHPEINFKVVSAINSKILSKFPNCKFFYQNERLDRNQINSEMKEIDYLIFFYSKESYTLSISGAFVDAINYLKPIIFLKNECISYYNDIYNIGIECKNLEHLIRTINSKELQKNYSLYITNIIKLKKEFQKNDFNLLWNKT